MVIFGFRTSVHRVAVLALFCQYCRARTSHQVFRRVTKFALFFIPLFPVAVRYRLQCLTCAAEQAITSADAARLAAGSGAADPC